MKTLSAVVAFLVLVLGVAVGAQDASMAGRSLMKATFGKLPIYFVENRSVYPDLVAYYVQGSDKTLFFTKDGITFRLKGTGRDWVVKLDFVGADPDVVPQGEDRQQAVFSYFRGPEEDWKTGLKTYSKIVYRNLWPGIDLVYQGTVNRLKYEFQVAPGANPRKIRLRYRGVTSLAITDTGALRVETPAGSFEDAPPVAWQEIDGKRAPVEMRYQLAPGASGDTACFGFDVGKYDRARPLVLDPAVIVYCGYIGGGDDDRGQSIAVDSAGNAYVTGLTYSSQQTFPVTVGPDLAHNGGLVDAFVAKVNSAGTAIVYCGYLGGSECDAAYGIDVDSSGHAYVTGRTGSAEQTFPVRVGPDLTFNGLNDAFVAKVNPQGTALVYCGYLGGAGNEEAVGIAVDASGNAYITGWTESTEQTFPVKVGPDPSYNGGVYDAFVAKVNAAGTALLYCGYVGGRDLEFGQAISVDTGGSAYITGNTESTEQTFPVTVGPDLTHNGGSDVFVARVNGAGAALAYCGYIGGRGDDYSAGIAVDTAGNAYVTGSTNSTEQTFPVTVGPDLTHNGGIHDAFVAKVNPAGTALLYCGYIGGSRVDYALTIDVDCAGNAHIAGGTDSTEQTFPVAVGPDLTHNGGYDVFVAKVNAQGTGHTYCGYLGGLAFEVGHGIAVGIGESVYITGYTDSTEQTFPVAVGPDLTQNGGWYDAFVAKISTIDISGHGSNRPGGTVNLRLRSGFDAGRPYVAGSSLGTGPFPIGARVILLALDDLLVGSVTGVWPSIFSGYRGVLDSNGQAQAAIHIPNIPALIGIWIHTAFVTLDPQAPSGIKSVSDTFSFPITK